MPPTLLWQPPGNMHHCHIFFCQHACLVAVWEILANCQNHVFTSNKTYMTSVAFVSHPTNMWLVSQATHNMDWRFCNKKKWAAASLVSTLKSPRLFHIRTTNLQKHNNTHNTPTTKTTTTPSHQHSKQQYNKQWHEEINETEIEPRNRLVSRQMQRIRPRYRVQSEDWFSTWAVHFNSILPFILERKWRFADDSGMWGWVVKSYISFADVVVALIIITQEGRPEQRNAADVSPSILHFLSVNHFDSSIIQPHRVPP